MGVSITESGYQLVICAGSVAGSSQVKQLLRWMEDCDALGPWVTSLGGIALLSLAACSLQSEA